MKRSICLATLLTILPAFSVFCQDQTLRFFIADSLVAQKSISPAVWQNGVFDLSVEGQMTGFKKGTVGHVLYGQQKGQFSITKAKRGHWGWKVATPFSVALGGYANYRLITMENESPKALAGQMALFTVANVQWAHIASSGFEQLGDPLQVSIKNDFFKPPARKISSEQEVTWILTGFLVVLTAMATL